MSAALCGLWLVKALNLNAVGRFVEINPVSNRTDMHMRAASVSVGSFEIGVTYGVMHSTWGATKKIIAESRARRFCGLCFLVLAPLALRNYAQTSAACRHITTPASDAKSGALAGIVSAAPDAVSCLFCFVKQILGGGRGKSVVMSKVPAKGLEASAMGQRFQKSDCVEITTAHSSHAVGRQFVRR